MISKSMPQDVLTAISTNGAYEQYAGIFRLTYGQYANGTYMTPDVEACSSEKSFSLLLDYRTEMSQS